MGSMRECLGIWIVFSLGCGPTRPSDLAAKDVEVERAILWEFRNDSRFDGVRVRCVEGVATLGGWVATRADGEEAIRRAQEASDARIVSELEIRQR